MSDVTIDWSSAEVRRGRLEVGLSDDPAAGWKETFDGTIALLHGGDWGTVKLKKRRIRVRDVSTGSEERLRHFLESAVAQTNATRQSAEDQASESKEGEETTEPDGPDAEMTERFRSFAHDAPA